MTEALSPIEVGERLRIAREAAKVTQAAAAAALEVARTTVVAIEQGQRRAKLDELQRLASLYGISVNALLRREAVQVDLKPRFRRMGEQDDGVEGAVALLTTLVQAELELEDLLGVRRPRNDPPERPLMPGDVVLQAEHDAAELRQWLGIGQAPVYDIVSLLELQLGVRVFVRRLPAKVSGLYAYDEAAGPCVLLNGAHPRERRAQTGAHELGHLVSTRRAPDALYDGSPETSREERYANAFARAFLTPARAVMAMFRDVTAGSSQLTRRHVIVLAHAFGVAREAMVRRLEELSLTKVGTWDWFEHNGGITNDQARQVLGEAWGADARQADAARPVSLRLGMLAREAWRQNLLSEGQLAGLLQLDRVEIRELIDAFEDEEVDDAPSRPLI
ncbi:MULTISPECIES: ImmA/IrrE family metallo-endopeptidase [unclassified Caulobacter]|mgnify:FL=1|jgi:Zn-dependent peptidase ImmA (M78 family)|uniref:XRE family transcriptional regulator n=1 Tax=unclassified Caulobacter TaxID=2648921 RepID=UPI00082D08D9|nr:MULTISPECIES: ImmA/IrrE family metallo-endopeptidase [unclassified Caulobacter]MBQ1562845.1 ImmA/IrrE family metallo-endopeptidase [Caulobacter sp.]PIB96235.1 transcriptional regulator [Caulobacter sp. X]